MANFYAVLLVVAAYLVGAIPFGYILTRYHTGKNILKEGSGNVGSTNVRRVAGRKVSFYTQILDILKGLIPVGAYLWFIEDLHFQTPDYLIYLIALASIAGHDFSIFLGFKGGKGVNTTLGASLLLAPWAVVVGGGIYFVVKKSFQYVSLGSIALSVSLPLTEYIVNGISPVVYYLIICALLIIILHRNNIQRLIEGKENR